MTPSPAGQKKRPLSITTQSRLQSLDRLKGLLKQETVYRIDSNYIPEEFPDKVVEEYAVWRFTMVDWFQQIMGTFQYEHETMEVTMSILDRYVASKPELMKHSKSYKLAALTSLYVAAKMHEQCCLTPHHVNDLSTDIHEIKRIEQEELSILMAIGWRVNPPTPTAFSRELFAIIPSDLVKKKDEIVTIFNMQMKYAMLEEIFVTEKPSLLVLAALYNAITSVHKTQKIPKFLQLRLFSALGLPSGAKAEESINKIRQLLLTVSLAREKEDEEEGEHGDDTVREGLEASDIAKESNKCSSPRTTASTLNSCAHS